MTADSIGCRPEGEPKESVDQDRYGEQGSGPIGPNETLATEIELIEILK